MTNLAKMLQEAIEAMECASARMSEVKRRLDAGIPDGEPVHPQSADLTWQVSNLSFTADRCRRALANDEGPGSFQDRVKPWLTECFGEEIAGDKVERNHRFLEESLELVQACGCTANEAYQLVEYVFGRPVGERSQEVGGVMVTLAALCLAQGIGMHEAGETELARIWTKMEQIRKKQASKPKNSPLPESMRKLDDLASEKK